MTPSESAEAGTAPAVLSVRNPATRSPSIDRFTSILLSLRDGTIPDPTSFDQVGTHLRNAGAVAWAHHSLKSSLSQAAGSPDWRREPARGTLVHLGVAPCAGRGSWSCPSWRRVFRPCRRERRTPSAGRAGRPPACTRE